MEQHTRPVAKAPGRLSQALMGILMKSVEVVASEQLTDRFRLITLQGPALAGAAFVAGQKIQVAMGSAFVARTYTPIDSDPVGGRTRILGYAHGDGPGSNWVRRLEPGEACSIFGPRSSLDTRQISRTLAVFGDETSIGLAHALRHQDRARAAVCHFEVDDIDASRRVTAHLELRHASLHRRRASDAHLAEMEAALPALIALDAAFILSGKSTTIQRLRQSLKRQGVAAGRILSKAYWAPGKSGLD